MSNKNLFLFIFTICSFYCEIAKAEIAVGSTLEWLTDTCPYIGIYTASKISPDAPGQAHIEASLSKSMRSEAPKTFSFDYPTFDTKYNKADCALKEGDNFLIFLRDAGNNDTRWEHIINLTCPATRGFAHVAIRPDFSLLTDGTAIEKVVRDRIAKGQFTAMPWRKYPDNRFDIRIPFDTPAFTALFSGSTCYLIIPSDLLKHGNEVLESIIGQWTKEYILLDDGRKNSDPRWFLKVAFQEDKKFIFDSKFTQEAWLVNTETGQQTTNAIEEKIYLEGSYRLEGNKVFIKFTKDLEDKEKENARINLGYDDHRKEAILNATLEGDFLVLQNQNSKRKIYFGKPLMLQ